MSSLGFTLRVNSECDRPFISHIDWPFINVVLRKIEVTFALHDSQQERLELDESVRIKGSEISQMRHSFKCSIIPL